MDDSKLLQESKLTASSKVPMLRLEWDQTCDLPDGRHQTQPLSHHAPSFFYHIAFSQRADYAHTLCSLILSYFKNDFVYMLRVISIFHHLFYSVQQFSVETSKEGFICTRPFRLLR